MLCSVSSKHIGSDGKYAQKVCNKESALVSVLSAPPIGESLTVPFRQYMTDDGLVSDGSNNDMQRTGTLAAPVEFWIPAHEERDRYITNLSLPLQMQVRY